VTGNRLAARTRGWWPEVATKALRCREEDGESGATAGLSLAARENERQGGQRGSGPVVQGRVGEGGVDGATRGTTAKEGPSRRPRPGQGGHGQRAAEHVTIREMSERERES
jgi:hypothetical protein